MNKPTISWSADLQAVMQLIVERRHKQVAKWGFQDHDLPKWQLILSEEVGELAKAILEMKQPDQLHEICQEAIDVAAVAAAIIQAVQTQRPV